jgi:hypothetical protein
MEMLVLENQIGCSLSDAMMVAELLQKFKQSGWFILLNLLFNECLLSPSECWVNSLDSREKVI